MNTRNYLLTAICSLRRSARCILLAATIALLPVSIRAQAARDDSVMTPIRTLFQAMQAGDTVVARAQFAPFAHIIPIRVSPVPAALTVDQFVAFVGTLARDAWREQVREYTVTSSPPIAAAWFDYEVRRADGTAQCGRQSVQLAQTSGRWTIVSMAFTARPSCDAR